jgi:hypothetical protein
MRSRKVYRECPRCHTALRRGEGANRIDRGADAYTDSSQHGMRLLCDECARAVDEDHDDRPEGVIQVGRYTIREDRRLSWGYNDGHHAHTEYAVLDSESGEELDRFTTLDDAKAFVSQLEQSE